MLFDNWKQYITKEDYDYLINFVENIQNNKANDKMIILAGSKNGKNGKTLLINEIHIQIGSDNFLDSTELVTDNPFCQPIRKLIYLTGLETWKNKKNIQQLLNVLEYKQSIITDTNKVEDINIEILNKSRIIQMPHEFN